MLSADGALPGLDLSRASIARVWNAIQLGKDNFDIDRAVARRVHEIAPQITRVALANERFRIRACQHLARAGIRQYLDCGPGMPSKANTHDVVQRLQHDARVLYVDNDPLVLTHGRALLATNDRTRIIAGDLFDPANLLLDPDVQTFLDWSQPIAILHTCTLHCYLGDDVAEVMKTYVDALAPGSYTVISHLLNPQKPAITPLVRQIEERFADSSMGAVLFRTLDEIRPMFGDQELVGPGLVVCDDWPSSEGLGRNWVQDCIAAGIGRKS